MRIGIVGMFSAALALGVSQVASAADLPARPVYKAPAAVVAATWTGFYVGGNVGGAWSKSTWATDATTTGEPVENKASSVIGGVQVGARYQFANGGVIGVEGMYDWTDLDKYELSTLQANLGNPNRFRSTHIKSLYSATGSIGFAWSNLLAYAKGGWAGARADLNADNLSAGGFLLGTSLNLSGYTVGGGVEARFWNNWSVGIEYDYYRLSHGDVTNLANSGGTLVACAFCGIDTDIHTVLARLNYTFRVP